MAPSVNEFSLLSFNLHGFSQGENFLKDICENIKYDMISIQEHWLTPVNMVKLKSFSCQYLVYGKSAMESAISAGFLRGRPFGGAAIMLNKKYGSLVKQVVLEDRFVLIVIGDCVFVNVYMPNDDGSEESLSTASDVLAAISDVLVTLQGKSLFIMGDFNVNLNSKSNHAKLLNDFLSVFDVVAGDQVAAEACQSGAQIIYDNHMYTFCNEKRGIFTKIDYICFPKSLMTAVKSYCTIDSPLNNSDHVPLSASLDMQSMNDLHCSVSLSGSTGPVLNSAKVQVNTQRRLRWDHSDIEGYYNYTCNLLYPIYNDILYYTASPTQCSELSEALVESWYNSIVHVMQDAANIYIQAVPDNCYKSWWNEDLKNLKSRAMQSHNIWEVAGKPKHGPLFDIKTKDKLSYKQQIRHAKDSEDKCISNSLHETLLSKSTGAFWKTWNSKINKRFSAKIEVVEGGSDLEISTKFADFFQQACTPNSEQFDSDMKERFKVLFNNYVGDVMSPEQLNISAEAVSLAVMKVNEGKAPGLDGLMIEHVLHCHPIIYTLLAQLFNIVIASGHVPSDFGRGIIIPLPKEDKIRGSHKIDTFRGITLSPILSKVFEHCLMELLCIYLYTDDHQFGFKANTGCSHALYTVRLVVDYFVQNDSTANICLIDVSKAFDKVNHSLLFMKLMKRHIPVAFILVLKNWYNNVEICVRWNGVLSQTFKVTAGVRQGGILSPVLFLIYVNDLLVKLNKCGCTIGRHLVAAFMYADDLLLLSPSVFGLQSMINACDIELELLDLKLNVSKSVCIRIGPRHNRPCSTIKSKSGNIPWVAEARYLGIYILSSRKFVCNFDHAKAKYYRSSNAILGKLGKQRNPVVALQLISSIALPVLTFGLEALCLNKAQRLSLEHPWDRAFMKIYATFDKRIVQQCQYYGGFLPISITVDLKRSEFLKKMKFSDNMLVCSLSNLLGQNDIEELAERYNSTVNSFLYNFRNIIYEHYDAEIKTLYN